MPISDYRDFYIDSDRLRCDKHQHWSINVNSLELPDVVHHAEGHYATDHAAAATLPSPAASETI